MKFKHYIYAGLDFIIDKNNKPWFLEANYFPQGVFRIKEVEKKEIILREFSKTLKKYKNPCMLISLGTSKYSRYSRMVGELLKSYEKINLCYTHKNKQNKKYLKTTENKKVKPDIIFRWDYPVTKSLQKKTIIINSYKLKNIVNNKLLTQEIIRKNTKVAVPKSFMIKNKSEIKDLLNEKEFEQGFVIKPNDETEGKGIFIFNKNSKNIPQIRKEEILQQRIIPNLRKGKYWDVRVFVINGKYCGGFIRESKSRITNISKGAKAKKITPDIAKILKKPAERATKAIEKYCQKK